MFSKRLSLMLAGLLILASLAACAPVPPATQAPATQAAPAQQEPAPTATTAPTETPAPTPTPAPTNTPAVPDPKTDPAAALLYASTGQLFQTAEFTYTMTMTMTPADDASAKALGAQADQLAAFQMATNGSGAMEITDPTTARYKMRMDMDLSAAGQQMNMRMVMIDQTVWVKLADQDAWQMVDASQAKGFTPSISPDKMMEEFKNAVDVQWVEDVTQGSETLSHLRFTMDYSKLDLGSLTSGFTDSANLTAEQTQAMLKEMKPVIDVWLAKPTLQMRGEKMHLDFVMPLPKEANVGDAKIRASMTMDMQFSKVNEPLTIEAPTANVTPMVTPEAATPTPTK